MYERPTKGHEIATNEIMKVLIDAGRAGRWSRMDGVNALVTCLAAMMVANECEPGNENAMFSPVFSRLTKAVDEIYRQECAETDGRRVQRMLSERLPNCDEGRDGY